MRVIIITSSSNRSGGTRQAVYQAQGLSERGHDVALCLPHDSTLWELPNAASNPLWNMLPEEPAQHRAYVESLFPSPDTPTIVHAFHNKAVKRVAWWGLFSAEPEGWPASHIAASYTARVIPSLPFAFNEGLPSQFGSLCPGNQLVLPQVQNPRHPKRHSR